jgi:hypothetical protein
MNYAAAWFLVMIGGSQYIGPMSMESCQKAAVALQGEGIICRQPNMMMACGVDGRPGTFTTCPVFDFPQVTLRRD